MDDEDEEEKIDVIVPAVNITTKNKVVIFVVVVFNLFNIKEY